MNSDPILNLRANLANQSQDVLLPLLSEYAQRWRHNSNQIWSIGSVFIPLSMSGAVITFTSDIQAIMVAIFSIALIWIWYLISRDLRSTIDLNWKVYAEVESALLKIKLPRGKYGLTEYVPSKRIRPSFKTVRLFIPILITVAWIVIVVYTILF